VETRSYSWNESYSWATAVGAKMAQAQTAKFQTKAKEAT